ncbi:unnamed protein product [Closterium sp. Naga37s-1]|nr:unnamed protein product [Closterium sp. Naga37s-1]
MPLLSIFRSFVNTSSGLVDSQARTVWESVIRESAIYAISVLREALFNKAGALFEHVLIPLRPLDKSP